LFWGKEIVINWLLATLGSGMPYDLEATENSEVAEVNAETKIEAATGLQSPPIGDAEDSRQAHPPTFEFSQGGGIDLADNLVLSVPGRPDAIVFARPFLLAQKLLSSN